MPPHWLTALAWASLGTAVVCAVVILSDVYGRGYRQPMPVMEAVWPVTALHLGPLAVAGYWRYGQPATHRWRTEHDRDTPPDKPRWATAAVGVSHCGAGCTLGDIIAEFAIFALGAVIAGQAVYAEMLGDYLAALTLGIAFQYFAIAPMRGLTLHKGLTEAAKADLLSLTAFQIGLFGWMALTALVFFPAPHHLHPDAPVYWLLMQIGMAIGFATAWPANAWLIHHGIKEAM